MRAYELIELLEKVKTRDAFVCVHCSSDGWCSVENVVVEHDMSNNEVTVILKTDADD